MDKKPNKPLSKKEIRKNIESKLVNALEEMAKSADKKFKKAIKKSTHILADAFHPAKKKPVAKKKKAAIPPVKATVKKAVVKKTAKKK